MRKIIGGAVVALALTATGAAAGVLPLLPASNPTPVDLPSGDAYLPAQVEHDAQKASGESVPAKVTTIGGVRLASSVGKKVRCFGVQNADGSGGTDCGPLPVDPAKLPVSFGLLANGHWQVAGQTFGATNIVVDGVAADVKDGVFAVEVPSAPESISYALGGRQFGYSLKVAAPRP